MKSPFKISVVFIAFLALVGPNRAVAARPGDGGADGDASVEAGAPDDGGSVVADDATGDDSTSSGTSNEVPLACDGALCDTTTGGTTCDIAEEGLGTRGAALPTAAALLLGAVGFGTLRRRARRGEERAR
jgi:hypothetical protein